MEVLVWLTGAAGEVMWLAVVVVSAYLAVGFTIFSLLSIREEGIKQYFCYFATSRGWSDAWAMSRGWVLLLVIIFLVKQGLFECDE